MELKVWVDGVQRVVCGITKQTTVQEVVIALAQATGRTGRYTLVEKWKTTEKMLPPSEYPLQILSNRGDRGGEVQFVLRRTGASTSVSESGDDKVVKPQRSTHRSSLPPQLKHKQRKDALLSRKEPKRKSLDISGGGNSDSLSKYKPRSGEKRNEEKVNPPKSPKKALVPLVLLQQARPNSRLSQGVASELQQDPTSKQPSSPKKKPLMPPMRREPRPASTNYDRSSSGGDSGGPSVRLSRDVDNEKRLSQSKLLDTAKARTEFTRLVMEQHEHVHDQNLTLETLDDEFVKFQAMVERREQSESLIQKEIDSLERTIQRNESEIKNETSLKELLQNEGYKGNTLQSESVKFKSDMEKIDEKIKEMEQQLYYLEQEIEQEKSAQAQRVQENLQNRHKAAELGVRKANADVSEALNQLKAVDDNIRRVESVINEKEMKLEALNRELRQVNLQQFIRQTGSKVTVLPPELETDATDLKQLRERKSQEPPVVSSSGGAPDAGGVWV